MSTLKEFMSRHDEDCAISYRGGNCDCGQVEAEQEYSAIEEEIVKLLEENERLKNELHITVMENQRLKLELSIRDRENKRNG